ncbi:MAG: glycosyltransferase family A protein [Mariprofundaceae bacterium]|nr:glycosyltransferase family A protein [Mariprofundaceae bacterium]
MDKKMTLSIVMPIYQIAKRFNFLKQALESLAKQTYEQLEIIIVDDGSKDNTVDLVDSFIKCNDWKYKNSTKLISVPINAGVSIARNLGISHASGELIAFLDWDDLLFPQYAEKVVDTFISNPSVYVVLPSGLFYVNYYGHEKAGLLDVPQNINSMCFEDFKVYLLENNFPAPMGSGICGRAELFSDQKIKFDAYLSKKTAEDILLGYQLLENGIRPYFILDEPIVLVRAYLNIASRGRGAVLQNFEFDAFKYIYSRCTHSLIIHVREKSESTYIRIKNKHDLTYATFEIKKLLLESGMRQAFSKSWRSVALLKKFMYYVLFLRVDPYLMGALYPLYVYYKTQNQTKSLATAKNYLVELEGMGE